VNTTSNGVAPADSFDRLEELVRELARRRLPQEARAEVDATLTRLEALLGRAGVPSAGVLPEGDGYLVTDRHGVILEANAAASALLNTRPEFLIGKPFPLYLAERHWPAVYSLLGQARDSAGAVQDWRVRLRKSQTGEGNLLSLTMLPLTQPDQSVRLRWLLRDVSRDAFAERALGAERAFADTLLDSAQAVALVMDSRGHVLRTNPYARAVTALADPELIGREWAGLMPPLDRHAARDALMRATQRGESPTFTSGLLTSGGPPRSVAWSVKAVERPEGRGPHVLALGHDVTELQLAQRRALQAERLAAIGQVTATMAHESRNLLQAATACVERLSWRLEGQLEALDLIRRTQQAHRGLVLLFEDVRLYAAPLRLNSEPCRLPELWREAFEAVRLSFPDRQAELVEEVACDVVCRADRFRLSQVFRNLMDNSFAACAGTVKMIISCHGDDLNGRPALRVSVRDNGPGLSQEQRQRLFEPFFTTKASGTGLGTTIAKRILEAHAGRIAAGEAAPGTEILFWLPRELP
jgi:PAS domain S-box-containing protein